MGHSRRESGLAPTTQPDPGVDHCVGIERDAVDALVQQPLGEVRMITGTLSADPHYSRGLAGRDCGADQGLDGGVAFVEGRGHQT